MSKYGLQQREWYRNVLCRLAHCFIVMDTYKSYSNEVDEYMPEVIVFWIQLLNVVHIE